LYRLFNTNNSEDGYRAIGLYFLESFKMNNLLKPALFALALTAPAIASADVETKQVEVNEVVITFNAADLASNTSRLELERQIRQAAEQVCGARTLAAGQASTLREVMKNRECYKNAVEKALNGVESAA